MPSENDTTVHIDNSQPLETSDNIPTNMDVDPIIVLSVQQTSTLPTQTANDSMHAKDNNDNMFKDTGFDYQLPPTVIVKDNNSWADDMENEESREQENSGATYNIITALTHFYVTDNASDIKGKFIADKHTNINSLFICYNGYQGSTYISKLRKFFVYFRTMNEL